MTDATFIGHDAPALRVESNYISRVDLMPFGFPNSFEQIWLKQHEGGLFEVCCIPFRAYGLALRDVVRVSSEGALVYELARQSGRRVLRVLLAEGRGRLVKDGGRRIEDVCHSLGLLSEWSGYRHVAIDVPADRQIDGLIEAVRVEEASFGADWEWADVEEFRPAT